MDREATPTLQPVPGIDLDAYKRTLIERFSNEHVRDTLARLCAESSDRIPKWLLPVIRTNLEQGGDIHRSAAVIANWARYDEGTDEQGHPIDVVDRLKEPLMGAASRPHEEPLAFISNRELFGDFIDNERFVAAYTRALEDLHTGGGQGCPAIPHIHVLGSPNSQPKDNTTMPLVAGVDSSTQSCKIVIRDAETGALLRHGPAPHPKGTEVEEEAMRTEDHGGRW